MYNKTLYLIIRLPQVILWILYFVTVSVPRSSVSSLCDMDPQGQQNFSIPSYYNQVNSY